MAFHAFYRCGGRGRVCCHSQGLPFLAPFPSAPWARALHPPPFFLFGTGRVPTTLPQLLSSGPASSSLFRLDLCRPAGRGLSAFFSFSLLRPQPHPSPLPSPPPHLSKPLQLLSPHPLPPPRGIVGGNKMWGESGAGRSPQCGARRAQPMGRADGGARRGGAGAGRYFSGGRASAWLSGRAERSGEASTRSERRAGRRREEELGCPGRLEGRKAAAAAAASARPGLLEPKTAAAAAAAGRAQGTPPLPALSLRPSLLPRGPCGPP